MLAGQLIFAAVAFYLVYAIAFNTPFHYPEQILQVVAIAFAIGGFYGGSFFFKRLVSNARELQSGPEKKFAIYQSACLLQWALIEGPSLLVIICFLFTGNYAFLALAAVLILIFAMLAPSKLKIMLHLQISEEQIKQL